VTPLLFLPGMMCDARLFAPQIASLSAYLPVMISPLIGADTIEKLASNVLHAAPARFALAGLSMGGIVAMEVVRQAPERVTHLALLDTNPFAEIESVKLRRAPQMQKARAGHLEAVMRDEMKPNYLYDAPEKSGLMDLCMDMALALGPDVFCDQSIALRDRIDQSRTLSHYKGRSLVLCGRHDVLCPVERHQAMHDMLSNSTFLIIEQAGHLPSLEKPEETTAALRRWLEV